LIVRGLVRWYRKYAPGDTVLEEFEKEAREGRKVLWADPHQCRRGNGEEEVTISVAELLAGAPTP